MQPAYSDHLPATKQQVIKILDPLKIVGPMLIATGTALIVIGLLLFIVACRSVQTNGHNLQTLNHIKEDSYEAYQITGRVTTTSNLQLSGRTHSKRMLSSLKKDESEQENPISTINETVITEFDTIDNEPTSMKPFFLQDVQFIKQGNESF